MKVLERTNFNNGYGCSCCRRDWEEVDWIDEEDMIPFETLITEKIKELDKNAQNGGLVGIRYESNGKFLYGIDCWIYKAGWDFYACFGDDDGYPDKEIWIDGYSHINKGKPVEEIIEAYENYYKERKNESEVV